MGDGEILRIGAKTAGDIEKFIRISEDDSEELVGDGIKIFRQGARFGFHEGWSNAVNELIVDEAHERHGRYPVLESRKKPDVLV